MVVVLLAGWIVENGYSSYIQGLNVTGLEIAETTFSISSTLLEVLVLLIQYAVSFGIIYLMLRIFDFQQRTYKTFFATVGSTLVIYAISLLVLSVLMLALSLDVRTVTVMVGITVFLGGIALVIWALFIQAHIFRRALDTTMGKGCLATIGYIVASALVGFLLTAWLLPDFDITNLTQSTGQTTT